MSVDAVTLNALNHAVLFAVLMAHALMYPPLKARRALVLIGCLLIILPFPLYHFLTGSTTFIYHLPLYVPLYMAYCVLVCRYLVFEAKARSIIFSGSSAIVHMQVIFLLIYGFMTQMFDFPQNETTHVAARGVYCCITLASLPLMHKYVRPHFRILLEAVERQRLWLIILLSLALPMLGNAMVSILLSRQDPAALRNCAVMAFGLVMFYYTLYSFLTTERAKERMENQIESAGRLMKTYEFYDAELREKEQALRVTRHDLRHMLLHLEAMLEDKDYEGLARHLRSLSGRTAQMRPMAYCENMTVNTLTAYHFAQARDAGVVCSSTLYVPETLAIPPAELAVIFGNALENAVKGAATAPQSGVILRQAAFPAPVEYQKSTLPSPETCLPRLTPDCNAAETAAAVGYIRFDAKPVKDRIVFELENNYRPGVYRKGAGVGLASIRELAEKNQGRARVEDADGVFRLTIVLRLN